MPNQKIPAEISDETWKDTLELHIDSSEIEQNGKTYRSHVLERTFTFSAARKRLGVSKDTLERALSQKLIQSFVDPENQVRLPAQEVERLLNDQESLEQITAFERIESKDIAIVTGVNLTDVRRTLQTAGLSGKTPRWGQIKDKWELPGTLAAFHEQLHRRIEEIHVEERAREQDRKRKVKALRREERKQNRELRGKLVAAFPSWRHEGRSEQTMLLHVGPPNSGKTHDALQSLERAGSGWYLAPLRLLAFEVFDRLNTNGIFCNLLTGEEHIEVPGAKITAATIEMFNPYESGECVIIDEAQMLADADRGWAWTRALMEAQSPAIHVIGPPSVQGLISDLAAETDIPYAAIEHERLCPIEVSERPWSLRDLPNHTILVAFSRQMVLHLKTELEEMKRTVSVVYGSLPPEVRRKQADRFAAGETEICVATDAVGMGLNLPADYVCFYEIEKFDGRDVRLLNSSEIQQIGGRAGRYGFSDKGIVGSMNRRNLKYIKEMFRASPPELTHARVAPTVEDLELIPGSLAKRLIQWAELQSIPDTLRDKVKTGDMSERIELAKMLTDAEINTLGLPSAVKLINAPTRKTSREYWRECADAILANEDMPLPPQAPASITSGQDLDSSEYCISCADIYLWLSQRREFSACAPDEPLVRGLRREWSSAIDDALLRKLDTLRRCPQCGKPLPARHPYRLCDNCFAEKFY